MPKNFVPTLPLESGIQMPIIGYGTSTIKDEKLLEECITAALEAGYRHFDTAFKGNYKREDIFLTTKLPPFWHRRDDVKVCVEKQLKALQMNYIDLYLIHSPCPCKKDPEKDAPLLDSNGKNVEDNADLLETWHALEELKNEGKIKNLGVSKFNEKQLLHLIQNSETMPVTNQVECHVLFPQKELHKFCKNQNIALTAFAPLGSPGRPKDSVNHPKVNQLEHCIVSEIAKKYGKISAQILLRNLIQRKIVAIPKSINPSRIRENIDIFDFSLDNEDIEKLETLGPHQRIFIMKASSEHSNYPYDDLKH